MMTQAKLRCMLIEAYERGLAHGRLQERNEDERCAQWGRLQQTLVDEFLDSELEMKP